MAFNKSNSIITIALSPCWDITCYGQDLNWQQHLPLDSQQYIPAGKALNVSTALSWMGRKNTAAGLWGSNDYKQMLQQTTHLKRFVNFRCTPVPGTTRRNITIIDTASHREMHLRAPDNLITPKAIKMLHKELNRLIKPDSFCIFAGSLPSDNNLDSVLELIEYCCDKGARVIVDTSGVALKAVTQIAGLWLIKPNLEEFTGLFNNNISPFNHSTNPKSISSNITSDMISAGNNPLDRQAIMTRASTLLNHVENVLISLGPAGAILVNQHGNWYGLTPAARKKSTLNTVGCGDYMLAGFIHSYINSHSWLDSLTDSIKAATAHAWALEPKTTWLKAKRKIKTTTQKIP